MLPLPSSCSSNREKKALPRDSKEREKKVNFDRLVFFFRRSNNHSQNSLDQKMRQAWLTLAAVSAVTAAGIAYVHASQVAEREALHAGVLRDDELLASKRAERMLLAREEEN